jgi:hypothetical protein
MAYLFAQVTGGIVALLGAWLLWGPEGFAVVGGMLLALGSLIIEAAASRREDTTE